MTDLSHQPAMESFDNAELYFISYAQVRKIPPINHFAQSSLNFVHMFNFFLLFFFQ